MFDAKQLWWPPLARLYKLLAESSASDSDADARAIEVCIFHIAPPGVQSAEEGPRTLSGMQERLKEYSEVLLHGVGFFRPPKSSSRTAVENEASLGIDKKKIPVAPELRSLALELSGYLVSLQESLIQ